MVALAAAFHSFVTQQGNDALANKQRSRVAVPVHTGGSALVIDCTIWVRAQLACFREMTTGIVQKKIRRRSFEQVTITGPRRDTDRQAKRSRIFAIRLVKEALAAQLSLRSTLSHVHASDFGRISEIHGCEMQILSIRSDYNGVVPYLFYAVGSMVKRELIIGTVGPTDEE